MSATWQRRLGLWGQGVIGAFIGGGAAAVSAGIAVPALDPSGDFKFLSMTWFKLIGAMFVTHGIAGAAMWLKQHPLELIASEQSDQSKP